jgi:hypothetical protein
MKRYAVTVTILWEAPSAKDALNFTHGTLANLEYDSVYQGYKDMRVEEVDHE